MYYFSHIYIIHCVDITAFLPLFFSIFCIDTSILLYHLTSESRKSAAKLRLFSETSK